MGKNLEGEEHHPGCMKGMFLQFHNHTLNFARKKLPCRRITHRKWIAVDEDDGETREKYDSRMYNSSDTARVSESGSTHKRSMKKRIKALISEEVSKRKGRHKRSSSCPDQTHKTRNSPARSLEPLDKSNAVVNEDIDDVEDNTTQSSPKVQEEVETTPCRCNFCGAMCTMNYMWQREVNDKGKRPVKDHTLLQDKLIYANDGSRIASLEESRLFLDALDLLNMRKELFLNVLRDPCSSLAQQMHEKRLSKSRVRLTKSMSFPSPRAFEAKDANFKYESHYLTHGDNPCSYASAGESDDPSMSLDVCSGKATPEQPQRLTSNVSPVSGHHLNIRQNKIVIKRFKNLGDIIRHAIKDSRKEKQRIIKDAVLHKIPNDKKSEGQGDTSEKSSKMYMKNNLGQKSFSRAPSFDDSIEKYNKLLESDPNREAKDKEFERPKLRTTVAPSPITSIPKRLNRIYSSPDLGLFHGLQSEEPLDSTCSETSITSVGVNCTSREGSPMSGKQAYLESNSNIENQTQMDKISKSESQENFVYSGEGLDAITKCENIEGAGKDMDRISKCESREYFFDADEFLDNGSKCESQENIEDAAGKNLLKISKFESQEDFVDDGEGLERIPKCESQKNVVDDGERPDKIFKSDSRENIEDVCEGSDRISKYLSREKIVVAGDDLYRILGCDSAVHIEEVDKDLDKKSKCESGENFVNAGFDYTGDLNSRNSAPNIDLIADELIPGDSSYQEVDTDPAKYNLPDGKLEADDLLHTGEDSLVSQQHEMSSDGTIIYENERGSSSTWFHDTSISKVQVDKNSRRKFDYIKAVLDLSGFNRNEFLGKWHSPGQPVDPEVLDEVEEILLVQSESSEIEDRSCDHILLFDLVNEVLLDIYHKSSSYWPKSLSFRSCIHPMPKGYHVLEAVWADINCYLRWKPTTEQAYFEDGDAVAQDLGKYDGWMNLQFDSECAGLELEELLFDDLIEELLADIQTLKIK